MHYSVRQVLTANQGAAKGWPLALSSCSLVRHVFNIVDFLESVWNMALYAIDLLGVRLDLI